MHTETQYLDYCFILTTAITLWLFIRALNSSGRSNVKTIRFIFVGICAWLVIQALLAGSGVYEQNIKSFPPAILLLGVFPALIAVVVVFASKGSQKLIGLIDPQRLTVIHTVRIAVELILFGLFIYRLVPEIMTFHGSNFDILAGITAPLIAIYCFKKNRSVQARQTLLIWNIFSLVLLLNIVVIAFLSAPTPLQRFGLDQPNAAILYFPYVWLPTFIVPVVLTAHLAVILQLLKRSDKSGG